VKRLCPKDKLRFEGFEGSLCPECDTESLPDLAGMVIAGRYELTQYIGIGGMRAPVYKALQISTRRKVAIKLLPIEEERTVSRFEREARIASKLNHRHVTIVHDYGQMDDDHMFLVMEFLQGTSLRDLLKRESPLTLMRALNIVEMILRGLEHAHNHAVVHRDLKPDNVFLVVQDEEEDFVKILDFGIAKQFGQDPTESTDQALEALTQETVLCGTPLYMAPEQITQESFDARIDIYAAGIVLFQMLTGRLPFLGRTSYEILSKHLTERAPLLSQTRPDIHFPPGLQDICAKAMAKKPAERFQSAREMRQAIREIRRALGAVTQDTENSMLEDLRPALVDPASHVGTRPIAASEVPEKAAESSGRGWVWALVLAVVLGGGGFAAYSFLGSSGGPSGVTSDAAAASSRASISADGDKDKSATAAVDKNERKTADGKKVNLFDKKVAEAPPEPPTEAAAKTAPEGNKGAGVDTEDKPAPDAGSTEPAPPTTAGSATGKQLAQATAPKPPVATTAMFKLTTTPPNAKVTLGGQPVGATPLNLSLTAGRHTIVISADGHQSHILSMDVTADQLGQTIMQSVALARAAAPAPAPTTATPPPPAPAPATTTTTDKAPAPAVTAKDPPRKRVKKPRKKKKKPVEAAKPTKKVDPPPKKKADPPKKVDPPKKKKAKIHILGGGGSKPKVKVLK